MADTETLDPQIQDDPAPGEMNVTSLQTILDDLLIEPLWRLEADKCVDYYDSNQLDMETLDRLKDRGMLASVENTIKPTIDAVLGLEAKTRMDWRVVTDADAHQDVAEALSAKLAEAERETRSDRACSDAYAGQIKAGFAAVEVSRTTDPYAYPYRVQYIHRREIHWDWRSQMPDWSDARWIIRKRWYDADVAAMYFPQQKDVLYWSAGRGNETYWEARLKSPLAGEVLARAFDDEHALSIDENEWRDTIRKRVCIYEIWYQVPKRGVTFKMPDGRVVEVDPKNQFHQMAIASGRVTPRSGVWNIWRCAYYAGPHKLADYPTKRRKPPYIPFFGYREDRTGIPYGLIRSMISTQDEINARRAKMLWLLSSRMTIVDDDALSAEHNSMGDLSQEVGRPDAFIVLRSLRKNADALKIDNNLANADAQLPILKELKETISQVSGVYAAFMGQQSNASSGTAIQSLVDQATMSLAEINDNHQFAKRRVGELLLEEIRNDMAGKMAGINVDTGSNKKMIYVNRNKTDELTGFQYLENNTATADVTLALEDIPSTPAYRAQQFAQLTEVVKSLPPEAQMTLLPSIIEASDLPRRREIVDMLKKKMGISDGSPEAEQIAQQQVQQAQQAAKQQSDLIASTIAKNNADANKLNADASVARSQIGMSADGAEVQGVAQGQVDQIHRDYGQKIADLNNQLGMHKAEGARNAQDIVLRGQVEQAKQSNDLDKERLASETQIEIERMKADTQKELAKMAQDTADKDREVDKKIAQLQQDHKKALDAITAKLKVKAAKKAA